MRNARIVLSLDVRPVMIKWAMVEQLWWDVHIASLTPVFVFIILAVVVEQFRFQDGRRYARGMIPG